MAIKCHSGFVHYQMFHNNHCHGGGNNYGSIFNITHNCGGGTNFWGGLGAGIGYGLGGMFSGLFGGLMGGFGNMFGGFGMNMFGGFGNMFGGFGNMFGNFGFDGFGGFGGWGFSGGLSNLWGGGDSCRCGCDNGTRRSDRYDRYSSKHEKDDKDYSAINDFDKRANAILAKIKSTEVDTEIDALVKELEDYTRKDNALDSQNETQINQLIERLKNHRSVTKPDAGAVADTGAKSDPVPVAPTPEATGKIGNKNIADLAVDDIAGINDTDYGALNDADKKKLQEKVYELASDKTKAKEWAQSSTLPSDLRAEAKRSFYEEGYENVKIEDLTDEALKNLVAVIDTSNITDFKVKNVTNIEKDENNKIKSFTMEAQTGTTVTYHKVSVVDGELIFHGKQDNQEYAVQKGSDNKYRLMQYEYHKGWGSADVTRNQAS